ncbi:MAG TPA: hypothetical protein VEW69_00455 [Alphaproteobacteria bacterium]|nr:hypothetical protein [Alphaproteobacteria bacterium]
MTRTRLFVSATLLIALGLAPGLGAGVALASDREFNAVVRSIESEYNTHRKLRFVMGFAGSVVKFAHVGGVKGFNGAIFTDVNFAGDEYDARFDEVVRRGLSDGWQPILRSHSRLSDEHIYIYAQAAGKDFRGKDLKLLIVTLEPSDALVVQIKINPKKLDAFLNEKRFGHGHPHNTRPADNDARFDAPVQPESKTETEIAKTQNKGG